MYERHGHDRHGTACVGSVRASMDDETARFMRHYWQQFKTTLAPNTWQGVPCWQYPCDAWIIGELITKTRPDVVVETGTSVVGSALLWASHGTRVLTVDTHDQHQIASQHPLWEQVTFIKGGSTGVPK